MLSPRSACIRAPEEPAWWKGLGGSTPLKHWGYLTGHGGVIESNEVVLMSGESEREQEVEEKRGGEGGKKKRRRKTGEERGRRRKRETERLKKHTGCYETGMGPQAKGTGSV